MKGLVSPLAALAMTLQPVAALSAPKVLRPPSRETRCELGGWTAPMIDKPIPVRAAPRADARVLGTLPTAAPPATSPDDIYPVDFSIIGARDGWLKISDASDAMNEAHARPVFGGVGWIEGGTARLGIQSGRGYARPDIHSEKLLDLEGGWLADRGWIVGLAGCSGKWVLVDYRLHSPKGTLERLPMKPYRAWFRGACGASETTCDMPSVDR